MLGIGGHNFEVSSILNGMSSLSQEKLFKTLKTENRSMFS